MDWSEEAENAVKKVPFFVRKRVKARVEKDAREAGKKEVSLADVKATQARYLKSMASEIKDRIQSFVHDVDLPKKLSS